MKRVWDTVAVQAAETGYDIHLDGRPMRLPGSGIALRLPNRAMADTVAAEWARAGDGVNGEFTMHDLPLTRLAATAQDRIAPDPASTAQAIAAYGRTDLLCYRAERPEHLALRQSRLWQPWLDWARRTYNARLRVGNGIAHVPQDAEALAALEHAVGRLDPWTLAALGVAVPALGSVVLGLALQSGELDAPAAHQLCELDATFQAEQWGTDDDAAARSAAVLREIADAEQFMRLARPPAH